MWKYLIVVMALAACADPARPHRMQFPKADSKWSCYHSHYGSDSASDQCYPTLIACDDERRASIQLCFKSDLEWEQDEQERKKCLHEFPDDSFLCDSYTVKPFCEVSASCWDQDTAYCIRSVEGRVICRATNTFILKESTKAKLAKWGDGTWVLSKRNQ